MSPPKPTKPRCLAGVFARAPVAGRTKTRLIPLLGASRAAELHRCMLLDTLERVASVSVEAVTFLSPAKERRKLEALGVKTPIEGQGGGDLGARMARALLELTSRRGVDRAFLIGTDSPDLPVNVLCDAARVLQRAPVVLGPAHDGGFTLIGARRGVDLRQPLRGVKWSQAETLEETVSRLCSHGLEPRLLSAWWDVDEPTDVALLQSRLTMSLRLRQSLPERTARFLGILDGS